MGEYDHVPISFGSRGFIRHDGTIFGWGLLSGEHRDYHADNGTTDADFYTRWRQWTKGGPIDLEARHAHPRPPLDELARLERDVEGWIDAHYGEAIPLDKAPPR